MKSYRSSIVNFYKKTYDRKPTAKEMRALCATRRAQRAAGFNFDGDYKPVLDY